MLSIAFILKSKIWLKGDVMSTLINSISEICLIHSMGIWDSGINPPTWFISVLIFWTGYCLQCLTLIKS